MSRILISLCYVMRSNSNMYLVSVCLYLVGNGVGGVNGNNINNNINAPPLAPCTRILAMNMIGDLMRKVGVSRKFFNFNRHYAPRVIFPGCYTCSMQSIELVARL